MITSADKRALITEMCAENGHGKLTLDRLLDNPNSPEMLRTFAKATLEPGASVGYHIHQGESESYYILSGIAEYNDNGTIKTISSGDVTYTPSGEGHGIKNIGTEPLEFIALIILE